MSVKRIVDTRFWEDDKVLEFFSPEDKLFMLYLITNPHTTQLGIYNIHKKVMAFELGYSTDTIEVLLDRFQNKYGIIRYSNKTKEIAIKNYLKYSIVKGGKPIEDLLTKELKLVNDKSLINFVYENVIDYNNLNETVKTIFNNYELNENVNVNVNAVSYDDTSTYRERIVKKVEKNKYGEFKNVLLTDEEYQKLKDRFNDYEEKIENLSYYLKSKGDKYKSHYGTILNWARKEEKTNNVPSWFNKKLEKEGEDEYDKLAEQYTRGITKP